MFGEGVKRKPSYAFFKAEFQLLELPKDFRYNEERKMSMKNELAKDITLAEWKSQYDMQCKKVLSNRTILAWILRDTVQEFSTMPVPDITTWGIFYGARLLSAQMGTEFSAPDYDNIKKVYSIWISMNAPHYIGNAISKYSIRKTDILPGIPDRPQGYDKMTVIHICLNSKRTDGSSLTKMLNILLSPRISAETKINTLSSEYQITMEREEMTHMCNLSDYVEEMAWEEGLERGRKEGIEKGMQEGMQKGMQEGMQKGMQKGMQEGLEKGKSLTLIEQIRKKFLRGKSLEETAGDLEEEIACLAPYYRAVAHNPQASADEIWEKLQTGSAECAEGN